MSFKMKGPKFFKSALKQRTKIPSFRDFVSLEQQKAYADKLDKRRADEREYKEEIEDAGLDRNIFGKITGDFFGGKRSRERADLIKSLKKGEEMPKEEIPKEEVPVEEKTTKMGPHLPKYDQDGDGIPDLIQYPPPGSEDFHDSMINVQNEEKPESDEVTTEEEEGLIGHGGLEMDEMGYRWDDDLGTYVNPNTGNVSKKLEDGSYIDTDINFDDYDIDGLKRLLETATPIHDSI